MEQTYSTDFLTALKRLTKWFNKKDFTEDQIAIWYDKIKYIPGRVLLQIVDQVIDTSKFMPTPNEIKILFSEYKIKEPGKFISDDRNEEDCEYCNGSGMIIAWKVTQACPYEYAIACGHCYNWRRVFPTRPSGPPAFIMPPKRMRIDDILREGYVLEDPYEKPWKTREPVETVDQAIDIAVNDIPF